MKLQLLFLDELNVFIFKRHTAYNLKLTLALTQKRVVKKQKNNVGLWRTKYSSVRQINKNSMGINNLSTREGFKSFFL